MPEHLKVEDLNIAIFENRSIMGASAAQMIATKINELLATQAIVNIIFAAAPSQNEVLIALREKNIDWSRINAFHMDEYIGLPLDAPQSFGAFLRNILFAHVGFRSVNYINGNASDIILECERYEALLKAFPTDIVCMGIGENGHLAFNDPPVADFKDTQWVKMVDLDLVCRQQQVNDGCFETLAAVPTQALTLTIPTLMRGKHLFCVVPGKTKQQAIYNTLNQNIVELYPSTILRTHPNSILILDEVSAALL